MADDKASYHAFSAEALNHTTLANNTSVSACPLPTMAISFVLNPLPSEADRARTTDNGYFNACLSARSTPPTKGRKSTVKRCNKAYSPEEVHCMQYHFEDLNLSWAKVLYVFIKLGLDESRHLTATGLQCRYYRAQRFPLLCIEAKPVLNAAGLIIMREMTKRERNGRRGLIVPILDEKRRPMVDDDGNIFMRELTNDERDGPQGHALRETLKGYFKFIDRVPELAEKYDWVKQEDKIKGKEIVKYNMEHGIVKPGAVLPCGAFAKTVMVDAKDNIDGRT